METKILACDWLTAKKLLARITARTRNNFLIVAFGNEYRRTRTSPIHGCAAFSLLGLGSELLILSSGNQPARCSNSMSCGSSADSGGSHKPSSSRLHQSPFEFAGSENSYR